MKIWSLKFLIVALICFVLVFLFSYVGNDQADRVERALLNAGAGVIGLAIGLSVLYKAKDPDERDDAFKNMD